MECSTKPRQKAKFSKVSDPANWNATSIALLEFVDKPVEPIRRVCIDGPSFERSSMWMHRLVCPDDIYGYSPELSRFTVREETPNAVVVTVPKWMKVIIQDTVDEIGYNSNLTAAALAGMCLDGSIVRSPWLHDPINLRLTGVGENWTLHFTHTEYALLKEWCVETRSPNMGAAVVSAMMAGLGLPNVEDSYAGSPYHLDDEMMSQLKACQSEQLALIKVLTGPKHVRDTWERHRLKQIAFECSMYCAGFFRGVDGEPTDQQLGMFLAPLWHDATTRFGITDRATRLYRDKAENYLKAYRQYLEKKSYVKAYTGVC